MNPSSTDDAVKLMHETLNNNKVPCELAGNPRSGLVESPQRGSETDEKIERIEGVIEMLPKLPKQNKETAVAFFPRSTECTYILLDEFNPDTLKQFYKDGFSPCCQITKSPKSYQVILKVKKVRDVDKEQFKVVLSRLINQRTSGDDVPTFNDTITLNYYVIKEICSAYGVKNTGWVYLSEFYKRKGKYYIQMKEPSPENDCCPKAQELMDKYFQGNRYCDLPNLRKLFPNNDDIEKFAEFLFK